MGIFTKKSADDLEAKARERAAKHGVNVDGVVAVGCDLQPGKATGWASMVVRGDRVEVIVHGGAGYKKRHRPEGGVLLAKGITGAQCQRDGQWEVVTVTGAGQSLAFRTKPEVAHRLRDAAMSIAS